MNITQATIEITRHEGVLSNVSVVMPTWDKIEESGCITVSMPLIGIDTFATDADDAEKAVEEGIKAFCIACEKFGDGLEAELKHLGWKSHDDRMHGDHTLLNLESEDEMLSKIMQTGEPVAYNNLVIA